jgi:hypothetical protein
LACEVAYENKDFSMVPKTGVTLTKDILARKNWHWEYILCLMLQE